jgi:predicted transcriptional regulator
MIAKLRTLRLAAGLSQWEISRFSGVDRSRISLIESGHVLPTESEITAIKRAIAAGARKKSVRFASIAAQVLAA